jgi:hypothetical protein
MLLKSIEVAVRYGAEGAAHRYGIFVSPAGALCP